MSVLLSEFSKYVNLILNFKIVDYFFCSVFIVLSMCCSKKKKKIKKLQPNNLGRCFLCKIEVGKLSVTKKFINIVL